MSQQDTLCTEAVAMPKDVPVVLSTEIVEKSELDLLREENSKLKLGKPKLFQK
jgi:hypothetical protein